MNNVTANEHVDIANEHVDTGEQIGLPVSLNIYSLMNPLKGQICKFQSIRPHVLAVCCISRSLVTSSVLYLEILSY